MSEHEMRWRGANVHDEGDEWERFVVVHVAFLGLYSVYFAYKDFDEKSCWMCKRCQKPLGALAPTSSNDYYFWCRRGEHGVADANDYHRK